MQSSFTRLPLRRCIHAVPPRPSMHGRRRVGLGLSAIAVAYFAWRLTTGGQRVVLDEKSNNIPTKQPWALPVDSSSGSSSPSQKSINTDPVPSPSPETQPLGVKEKTEEKVDQADQVSEQALPSPASNPTESHPSDTLTIPPGSPEPVATAGAGSDGEEEEGAEHDENGGAFDPTTGEINWDCPCLGGMAHGPCGPQFKEAFSCFVFSEDEPKGINCVEKFQAMQNCFREHPDVYADEIMRDDEEEVSEESEREDGGTTTPSSADGGGTGGDERGEGVPPSPSPSDDSKKLEQVDSKDS